MAAQMKVDIVANENLSDKISKCSAEIDKITNSSAPAKKQLRDLQKIMTQMNLDGLSNTDVFTRAAQEAGNLKDAMADAQTAISAFANDTFQFKAVGEGLQGIAAAGSVATGVMGLFGTENEKVQQILLKVQSAQTILNGVNTIANVLNKDSALMLKLKQMRLASNIATTTAATAATNANTVAEKLNNSSVKSGTVIQNAWNTAKAIGKAMVGDFTGLLLLGVGAVSMYAMATADSTDKIEEQTQAEKNAADTHKTYIDTLSSTYANLMGEYSKLRAEWNKLSSDHQRNEWIKENKSAMANLGGEINNVAEAESFFNKNTEAVVDAFKRRAKAAAYAQLMTEAYKKEMEMLDKGRELQDKYNVSAGDKTNWHPTDSRQATWDSAKHGKSKNGNYESFDGGVTWVYTVKGANEYNNALWTSNREMRELNEAYKENAANMKKYEQIYGELATTTKKVVTNTNTHTNTNKKNNTSTTALAGSLDALNEELSLLQKNLRAGLIPDDKVEAAKKRMEELKKQISDKEIALGLKTPETKQVDRWANSLYNQLSKQLQDIEEQLQHDSTLTIEAKSKLVGQANQLQKQLDDLSNHNNLTIPAKVEPKYIVKGSMEDMRQSVQNAYNQINDIADDYDLGLIDYKTATSQISAINKQLVALGAKPYKVEIESKFGKNLQSFMNGANQFNDVVTGIDNVVNSFDRLGKSIEDGANGWEIFMNAVNAAMSVLNTIASVMTIVDTIQTAANVTNGITTAAKTKEAASRQVNAVAQAEEEIALTALATTEAAALAPTIALVAAVKKLAAARIYAAHADIPFAGVATATAQVATMEATLAGITAFANGGIVQGKTTIGDYNLARVNGGEMILNNRQQKSLFSMLDKNRAESNVAITAGEWKLRGTDLYLSLKNLNKINSGIGKNIGIK